MQKQLDTIIRLLRATLTEKSIGDIFELKSAAMRISLDPISCNAWRCLAGDQGIIRMNQGEYMSNFSWAVFTEGYLGQQNR